jgi:hypothetical protein
MPASLLFQHSWAAGSGGDTYAPEGGFLYPTTAAVSTVPYTPGAQHYSNYPNTRPNPGRGIEKLRLWGNEGKQIMAVTASVSIDKRWRIY